MTKLEELAQKVENPHLSRIGIEHELQTALKPLLDAGKAYYDSIDEKEAVQFLARVKFGEQLSQWRKK